MTIPKFPPNWCVIPLQPGTKIPFPNFPWANLASSNPAQIATWADEYPDCNWGLATGASGLAVIDVDGPSGDDSLAILEANNDWLPTTLEQKTPHGRHLIFSGEVKPTVGILGPKLDTRGRQSYIVIEPSTIDGVPYVLNNAPIQPLPSFVGDAAGVTRERIAADVLAVLDTELARARATRLLADYCNAGHVAIAGQGGDALTYAVAAEVISLGLSPDVALDTMQDWNEQCQPPWDQSDLKLKILNASQYAQNDIGAWYVPPVRERIPAEALDKLIAESLEAAPTADSAPEGHGRFDWKDEDQLKNIPAPVWLIKDKLMRNSIAMLYGPSGHYKSLLALTLAAEVAQTGECAFYVAAEGIERMGSKDIPAWKLAYGEERKLPILVTDEMPKAFTPEDFVQFAGSIKAEAAGRPIGIIFLDTLNRAMSGLNDNDARDASKMVEAAEFLKKTFKCCVVLVHHTPKYDKEVWRGSGVFYNDFDTVLAVHADKETKRVKITVAKQKSAEEYAKPFWYAGRTYGPGLAFVPITDQEANLLNAEADIYSPQNISRALVQLKAFKPVWVSSTVLISHIVPQLENESPEDRKTSLSRARAGLTGAIKGGKLGGYFEKVGRETNWTLPVEVKD